MEKIFDVTVGPEFDGYSYIEDWNSTLPTFKEEPLFVPPDVESTYKFELPEISWVITVEDAPKPEEKVEQEPEEETW